MYNFKFSTQVIQNVFKMCSKKVLNWRIDRPLAPLLTSRHDRQVYLSSSPASISFSVSSSASFFIVAACIRSSRHEWVCMWQASTSVRTILVLPSSNLRSPDRNRTATRHKICLVRQQQHLKVLNKDLEESRASRPETNAVELFALSLPAWPSTYGNGFDTI